jgi:FkbM family methyltransferase
MIRVSSYNNDSSCLLEKTVKLTALSYYTQSIGNILQQVKHPASLVNLLIDGKHDSLFPLELRSGERFLVQGFLDVWVIKETFINRWYERASCALQPGWIVVDIGAALGDYSVWAAGQLTEGKVIAVEPYPSSVDLLKKNLEINNCRNVKVMETAVMGNRGTSRISGSSGSGARNSAYQTSDEISSISVNTISLQDLLDQNDISVCDYLKLDCEGAEYEILFASTPDLFNRLPRICMEIHDNLTPYSHTDMQTWLEEHGYRIRYPPNPVHTELGFLYAWREDF